MRSGQASYTSTGAPWDPFCNCAATRGFSNATFRRSTAWSKGKRSWLSLASTVQSSPPENSTATLVPDADPLPGGWGMFSTRRLRDAVNCSLSELTAGEVDKRAVLSTGKAVLNLPMLETWEGKFDRQGHLYLRP